MLKLVVDTVSVTGCQLGATTSAAISRCNGRSQVSVIAMDLL